MKRPTAEQRRQAAKGAETRSRLISKKFSGARLTNTDLRRIAQSERKLDVLDMWDDRPALKAHDKMMRELTRLERDMRAMAAQFGIDIPRREA